MFYSDMSIVKRAEE